jgi:glycogen phosphorylase
VVFFSKLEEATMPKDIEAFKSALSDNLYYRRGSALTSASLEDIYTALAYTVRDTLADHWRDTVAAFYKTNPKFVYYLSMEYLLGKQLEQNLLYTDLTQTAREALNDMGFSLDDILRLEPEPGLGNGGLGRLAACFMDSLATLNVPSVSYGIRYEFGIFKQTFENGWQVEGPDNWLKEGNPWEFAHPDDAVPIGFYGHTEHYEENGQHRVRWLPEQSVLGEPYHLFAPGYNTTFINMLRLWRARASDSFDFKLFDTGDYARAVAQKVESETISKVLYPNDNTAQGRELRLKQQYFFVACSLHDILRRFRLRNSDWSKLPEKVVIQLNDTHPVIAIPELVRLLVDEQHLPWDEAWRITTATFAYTNHTLLPEALETWPVSLLGKLLPRHLEIIFEINKRFLDEVRLEFPYDDKLVQEVSVIEENEEKYVRMANLASVGSFAINGVAELQSRLLRENVLKEFSVVFPNKFQNKTNGITPRRFVQLANPKLTDLITEAIGDTWLSDLEGLRALEKYATDKAFLAKWLEVKQENKQRLATLTEQQLGLQINNDSLFDVMAKRLHEYKRQLLKALHVVSLYLRVKDNPSLDITPRTFIFGAKAAPGYASAKRIIKLINSVAEVVNHDAEVAGRLKVVFLPNFNVSLGQYVYPAADLSEQISLAGKEASGTGNMKFALNGALTIGTLDGANIEILERVGAENFFLFGMTTEEVSDLKQKGYAPITFYHDNQDLKRVIDVVVSGMFSKGDMQLFKPLVDTLLYHDDYMLLADYTAYVATQDRVDECYRDKEAWARMSLLNTARCGFFSSDRTIRDYLKHIWHVDALPVRVLEHEAVAV